MKVVFPLSQVVIVIVVVVSKVLETNFTFGVVMSQAAATLGFATSAATMAASSGSPTISQSVHPSVV
jgi:lipid-binding SYLF domain-containing protein